MKPLIYFVLIGVCLSCSTMSKEECQATNWQYEGEKSGIAGDGPGRYDRLQSKCAEYGIAADRNAYTTGYNQGLQRFCTTENGQRVGTEGYYYNGVCPAELESKFLQGYNFGHQQYELNKREEALAAREDELRRKEMELHEKHHDDYIHHAKKCTYSWDCKSNSCVNGYCQ